MRRVARLNLAVLLVLTGFLTAVPSTNAADDPKADAMATFMSGDKKIAVEHFEPKGDGKHPVLLMLHGADGLEAHGKTYRGIARSLADKGYLVLIVHYFDCTGTEMADKKAIDKHYLPWMATIVDAMKYAATLPKADEKRLCLAGYSLGAYLSLSVAAAPAKEQPPIAAIVEHFGGLPNFFAGNVKMMPPTCILHGDKDTVVPIQEAYDLEKLYKDKQFTYELLIFKGEGHGFSEAASKEAFEKVLKFLDLHLSKPKAEPKDK